MFFLHQLNLIVCFGTASVSPSPLVLRIVLAWFVVFHVLAQFCNSWAYFDGTMHESLIVEVRIDWIKRSSSLSLT